MDKFKPQTTMRSANRTAPEEERAERLTDDPGLNTTSSLISACVYTRKIQPRSRFISDTKEPNEAWIVLTSSIRWKYMKQNKFRRGVKASPPVKLMDFSNTHCLTLDRLESDACLDDLADAVYCNIDGNEARLVVRGTYSFGKVELVILMDKKHKRELMALETILRIRIAPWKLLYNHLVHLKEKPPAGLDLSELRKQIVDFSSIEKYQEIVPESISTSAHKPLRCLNKSIWFAEHARFPSDAIKALSDFTDRAATIAKRIAPSVASSAQNIAEVTKCVGVVSSAFQLVALGVQIGTMIEESRRGEEQYGELHQSVIELQGALSKCFELYLQPSTALEDIQLKNAFKVQEESFELLASIEKELMRSWPLKITYSGNLRVIKSAVDSLNQKVLVVKAQIPTRASSSHRHFEALPTRPSLSPFFSGRDKERDQLVEVLQTYGSAAILQHGGAGKTQLMVYLSMFLEKEQLVPGGTFWIVANGNEQQILASLSDYVQRLSKRELSEEDRGSLPILVSILRAELGKQRGRWLLCLDNADNPTVINTIAKLLSIAKKDEGWVVLTSRQGGSTLWPGISEAQTLMLQSLSEESSVVVLWRMKANKSFLEPDISILSELQSLDNEEYNALKELCATLGNLPLALAQAGGYIYSRRVTFLVYLEEFREFDKVGFLGELLPTVAQSNDFVHPHQRAIFTTWKLNVDCLRQDEAAIALLRTIALLASNPVPIPLAQQIFLAVSDSQHSFNTTIYTKLANQASLLSEEHGCIRMHPLIRKYVLLEFAENRREDMERAAFSIHGYIQSLIGGIHTVGKPPFLLNEQLISAILHVNEFLRLSLEQPHLLTSIKEFDKLHDLHCFVHEVRHYFVQYSGIRVNTELYLEVLKSKFGTETNHPQIASVVRNLGILLSLEGSYLEAKIELEKCLEMWQHLQAFSNEHKIDLAKSMYDLSCVLLKLGMCFEAKELLEQCLEIMSSLENELRDDFNVASVLDVLGLIYYQLRLLVASRKTLTECLNIKYELYGSDRNHPSIAKSLRTLGLVLREQGDLEEAEKSLSRALQMFRDAYSQLDDHPEFAICLRYLGFVLLRSGDLKGAEYACSKSLKMTHRRYGETGVHPHIAHALNDLAVLKRTIGFPQEANKMFHKSLEIHRQVYGTLADHPHISINLQNLGKDLQSNGMYNDAEKYFMECLHMRQRLYRHVDNHPLIATVMSMLGHVARAKSRLQDAEAWFRKALDMSRKLCDDPSKSVFVISNMFDLGILNFEKGDLPKAEKRFKKCLAMWRNLYGKEAKHPHVSRALLMISLVKINYNDTVKMEEAEQFAKESLEMFNDLLGHGSSHWQIAECMRVEGIVLFMKGRLVRATRRVHESLEMFHKVYGESNDHPNIANCWSDIGLFLMGQGLFVQAESYFRKSFNSYRNLLLHRNAACLLQSLHDALRAQGRFNAAKNCIKERFRILRDLDYHETNRVFIEDLPVSRQMANVMFWFGKYNLIHPVRAFGISLRMMQEINDYSFNSRLHFARIVRLMAEELKSETFSLYQTFQKLIRTNWTYSPKSASGSKLSIEENIEVMKESLNILIRDKYLGIGNGSLGVSANLFLDRISSIQNRERTARIRADIEFLQDRSAELIRHSDDLMLLVLLHTVHENLSSFSLQKLSIKCSWISWNIVRIVRTARFKSNCVSIPTESND